MRAVRARLTALLACRLGLLDLLPATAGFFVAGAVVLAFVAVFGAVFFVVVVETVPAGTVADPPDDCPTTGCKTMSIESKQARERTIWRED